MHIRTALTALFILASLLTGKPSSADKIYVDITASGIKKLPIAIQPFVGAREVSDIVKADMTFTGIFDCLDEAAQIERSDQPFNPMSWRGLGVQMVVKGIATSSTSTSLNITISAYDVLEGREVLKKEYTAKPDLVRLLAHTISDDIYKILTGQPGIFKTKIAFVGQTSGTRQLYLMDWDGERMYPIGIKGDIILSPRWSRDGSKLIYSIERARKWGIYMVDMNAMRELRTAPLSGISIVGSFFPDNRHFAFSTSRDGYSDISIGDIGGSPSRKIIASPWIDVSPSVSPDGASIVFVSNRSGGPQVYMSDKEGFGVHRLTFQGNYNTAPSWSPSGDKIVYTSMIGGKNQVFIMKTDGSGITQLTNAGNNEDPCFSPDGRYVAFTSTRDGSTGVYVVRTNGEGLRRLSPKGFRATNPGWSPF
ncbi:MAG TPA: Tol-Pal system beta propeller repeat protein TolB [Dissulfurispiraceae bacterium]|nr:Tol-Pal system beta propeller repeat protein TolB [Dissulfurispiraceae bacterium]